MLTIHIKIISCTVMGRRQNPIRNMCIHICMNKKNTYIRPSLRSGDELVWWVLALHYAPYFIYCFFVSFNCIIVLLICIILII